LEDNTDYVNIKIVKHEKEEFSKKVIAFAAENKISYLDAALEIAETRKIEIEIVAQLLTQDLKTLIEKEASKFKLIKGDKNSANTNQVK